MHVGISLHIAVAIIKLPISPISDAWAMLKPLGEKNCVNLEAFFITSAAVNSVTDCLIYLYPIRYLWRVRLSLMKRLGLITCFSLGVMYVPFLYPFGLIQDAD